MQKVTICPSVDPNTIGIIIMGAADTEHEGRDLRPTTSKKTGSGQEGSSSP